MRTEVRTFGGMPVGIAFFGREMECLSSAILNGGRTRASALFIMQVPKDFMTDDPESDATVVRDGLGLPEDSVGMMTAAEVDYVFNSASGECNGTKVEAIATAGLSNHVVAGDILDNWPYRHELSLARGRRMLGGTINIAVVADRHLTEEAMVNMFIPLVEGKTVALNHAGYYETGTTSDSMAVLCPPDGEDVRYTGTGSDIGIAAARAVRAAVGYALERRLEHPVPEPPMTVLGRLGYRDMLIDAAKRRGLSEKDAVAFLDSYFSDDRKVSLVDMALFVSHRAESMAEDGHGGLRDLVDGMVESVLGSKLPEGAGIMDGLVSLLCKDIWMAEPSVLREEHMQALINAGGKGTRMGKCGIEKPMQPVGGTPTVERVINALSASSRIDRILVSVSDNTLETERYLKEIGIETIRTSGDSFMDDLHDSFRAMQGEYVLTCPSDLPMLTTGIVDDFIDFFKPGEMESAIAVIDEETVRRIGIIPSYTREYNGRRWVLSGLCIMNRQGTLDDRYLEEVLYMTSSEELAVNVNTQGELALARSMDLEVSRIP